MEKLHFKSYFILINLNSNSDVEILLDSTILEALIQGLLVEIWIQLKESTKNVEALRLATIESCYYLQELRGKGRHVSEIWEKAGDREEKGGKILVTNSKVCVCVYVVEEVGSFVPEMDKDQIS